MIALHGVLRSATSEAHAVLDRSAVISALLSPELTTSTYARVLGVHFVFLDAVESMLRALRSGSTGTLRDEVPPGLEARIRAPAALSDLKFLSLLPGSDVDAAACIAEADASLDCAFREGVARRARRPGGLLGLTYVTEGSTLGSFVIARALARHKSFTAEAGALLFAGRGASTHALWAEFLSHLEARDAAHALLGAHAHENARANATEAALFLFATLTRAFASGPCD